MSGKVVLWFVAFLLLIVPFDFAGASPGPAPTLSRIIRIYHKADSLYHLSNTTPVIDSTALAGFEEVIGDLGSLPGSIDKDTLLVQSWLKKGILLDSRTNYAGAKNAYLTALRIRTMGDSSRFVAFVYAGTCYYNLNNFDSANYFLLKAETLIDRFNDPEDEVRLYNTLGVLYYDNGNYRQGRNYFSRALEIVRGRKPLDTMSVVSIETNIATCYYRLGAYDESFSRYAATLRYHVFSNYVYMNMGRAYTALVRYREAIACFRKVNPAKIPWVYNELAHTEWLLNRPDSCLYFLNRLQPYRDAGKLNTLDIGINEQYRADLLSGQEKYQAALTSLQKAIIIFSGNFSNPNILSNPSSFTGTFTYYRLFDVQLEKARVFERLYRTDPRETWLVAAYEAYKTALAILRYIEKSYDTDDAKIFLKKKSGQAYQLALSVCLELYRLPTHDATEKNKYLEDAFLIGERNKASIIAAGMKERRAISATSADMATSTDTVAGSRDRVGTEDELLKRERNIKYNIARLNIRSDETRDTKEIEQMARERGGYEIELAHLQKELEQNDNYYRLKYDDSSPGVKDLQRRLGAGQALVSCYMTAEDLHIFTITKGSFGYARVDSLRFLQQDISEWLNQLKTTGNGRKFRGDELGSRLYDRLIRPIQALVAGKDEWIVIPDGMLYFLPFESLPASADRSKTLLETTTISYQFSSRFLTEMVTALGSDDQSGYKVLAFAPFAGRTGEDEPGRFHGTVHPMPGVSRQADPAGFNRLPASADEIAGLPGAAYLDSMATKSRFLRELNDYPIIHLATHAVSAIDNVSASFIAFYPEQGQRTEDCLFLEELYGLNMRSTKLVIISACETGQGELVNNEGVISLARAFAYAGCASTVCSLWKADDKATSFILRRFHIYLQEGYTKAKALQRAKLDYIGSDAVNKSPAYWSHLILIGDGDPVCAAGKGHRMAVVAIIFVLLAGGLVFILNGKLRKKKKSTIFTEGGS